MPIYGLINLKEGLKTGFFYTAYFFNIFNYRVCTLVMIFRFLIKFRNNSQQPFFVYVVRYRF